MLLAVVLLTAGLAAAAPAFADQRPTLWVSGSTVDEGDSGTTTATFTVHRTAGAVDRTVVTYDTRSLSASEPSDFTDTTGQLVIPAGFDTGTVRVPVVGDTRPEGDEQFQLVIDSATAILGDRDAVVTILDDDRLPGLSIGDSTVTEGDSGTVGAVFPVSLDRPSAQPVRVRYATSNFGSATSGVDYVPTSGTLTIPAGNTSATITVPVKGDTAYERGASVDRAVSESFYVGLSDPVNATILDTTTFFGAGFGRILDDDKPPYLRVLGDGQIEGGTETFQVKLSGPAKNPVTAFYDVTSYDTSLIPNRSGLLTFAPGETTKTVTVATVGDCVDQGTGRRAISFDLSDVTGAILQNSNASGLIFNDDDSLDAPSCNTRVTRGAIFVDAPAVVETDTGAALRFTIYGRAVNDGGGLHYETRGFGATSDVDFTAVSGSAGAGGSTIVTVPVTGDDLQENDEYFYLEVQRDGSNAADDHATGQAFIIDDDVAPLVSVSDASVEEGDAGTTSDVTVEISLAAPSLAPSAVRWQTTEGSADDPSDYVGASGTALFQPGETTQVIHLTVNGDDVDEPDERLSLFVFDDFPAANATRSDNTGVVVILDDDRTPMITVDSPSFAEGTTGTTPAHFTVALSLPSALPVTVAYDTTDAQATSPADFTSVAGTLTFAPGETEKTVDVSLQADSLSEQPEFFGLRLQSPTNAVVEGGGTLFGFMTILDDDRVPGVTVGDISVVEPDTGTAAAAFVVKLTQGTPNPVTVAYTTGDNTAVAPGDYTPASGTVTFAPGQTSRTVTVPVVGDTVAERSEDIALSLSAPTNAYLQDRVAYATIVDTDVLPGLTIRPSSVVEGNSGTRNASVTVTLQPATVNPVTVGYATSDNSARAGEDYTAVSGTLSFAPNETTKTFTVPVTGDVVDESDESFSVDLSNPVNATLFDGGESVTIFDDDPTGGGAIVTVDDAAVLEPDTASTTATVALSLTPAAASPVSVRYRLADGTATAGTDYTAQTGIVTFAAGQTTAKITVAVMGDVEDENDERFAVQLFGLSGPANTRFGNSSSEVIVLDDEFSSLLSIDDLAVDEGGADSSAEAVMTVRLHLPSPVTVSVDWRTTFGSAGDPADYLDTGGTLVFAPGQTTRTVRVTVKGDGIIEGDEYVNVELGRPVNASLSRDDASAPLVIVDSDAYDVVGAVTGPDGTGRKKVTVKATGGFRTATTTTTATDGSFVLADLPDGRYTVTPSATGTVFVPASAVVDVHGGAVGGVTFLAVTAPAIGGRVVDVAGVPVPGVTVTRSGNAQANATTVTNGAGYYAFSAVPAGSYTVKPTLRGATFTPGQRSVTVAATATAPVTASFAVKAPA